MAFNSSTSNERVCCLKRLGTNGNIQHGSAKRISNDIFNCKIRTGTDGLKMKDLPDVAIQGGVAICTNSPMRITVRAEISKARHQYFTFATAAVERQYSLI